MPRKAKYPTGKMTATSFSLTAEQMTTAARIGDTVSDGTQKALDAVRLLTPEQWAWLAEYGTPAEVLAEAVQFRMDVERAEAQAEDLAPTYNGGRW